MADHTVSLREGAETHQATVSGATVTSGSRSFEVDTTEPGRLRLRPADGDARTATAFTATAGDQVWVFLEGEVFRFDVAREGRRKTGTASAGSLTAPMPATVRRVEVQPGQRVHRGDILVVLEAMKMELPVRAPGDGAVARVNCREGELVPAGHTLVELTP